MLGKADLVLRKGSGIGVAVYSSGPDETFVQAELLLLCEKAQADPKLRDSTVFGYYDVVRDTTVTDWLKSYDGRTEDYQRLLALRAQISDLDARQNRPGDARQK